MGLNRDDPARLADLVCHDECVGADVGPHVKGDVSPVEMLFEQIGNLRLIVSEEEAIPFDEISGVYLNKEGLLITQGLLNMAGFSFGRTYPSDEVFYTRQLPPSCQQRDQP